MIKKKILTLVVLILILFVFFSIDNYLKKPADIIEIDGENLNNNILMSLAIENSTSTKTVKYDPSINTQASTTPQFILLSFDGSKSNEMWKETIDFVDSLNIKGIPIHFTYFINAAYLLAKENRNEYTPPSGKMGESAIGFSEGLNYIDERISWINKAIDNQHEIGSHTVGHWKGEHWTIAEWQKEFSSFNYILLNIEKNNPQIKFKNILKLKASDIKGFRAPDLSINDNMYSALALDGFNYDSSGVSIKDEWPLKDHKGIWHVPISTIYFPSMHKNIIAVDYSVWVNQTEAKDKLKKGTKEWEIALNDITEAYTKHFEKNYKSNRAPIVIDDHFSKWNDGLYWEALKKFAEIECGKVDVRCSTFSDLIKFMEKDTNKI